VVVVELCQYRVSMLKMDEKTLLKEAKDINLEKVQQAIKQVRHETEDCSDIVIILPNTFINMLNPFFSCLVSEWSDVWPHADTAAQSLSSHYRTAGHGPWRRV